MEANTTDSQNCNTIELSCSRSIPKQMNVCTISLSLSPLPPLATSSPISLQVTVYQTTFHLKVAIACRQRGSSFMLIFQSLCYISYHGCQKFWWHNFYHEEIMPTTWRFLGWTTHSSTSICIISQAPNAQLSQPNRMFVFVTQALYHTMQLCHDLPSPTTAL